jgi:hypothetical protein
VHTVARAARPAAHRLLSQYLLACPGCGEAGAAHVDRDVRDAPVLVRFVCPQSCVVSDQAVLALVPAQGEALTA